MTLITYTTTILNIVVAVLSLGYTLKSPSYILIRYYCLTKAIVDIVACIFNKLAINNIPLLHILIWCELFLLLQFFFTITPSISRAARTCLYLAIYLALTLIFISFESFSKFTTHSLIFEGGIIFIYSLNYLNYEFNFPKVKRIIADPTFWFVSGLLIYYGCSWLILLGSHYLISDQKAFVFIWDVQNVLDILKNIFIIIGFKCLK